ncbi:MAG: hypothetical protein OEY87_05195 [Gammaproteobacteria bacterium]|nr:hypothetical protein [Gammaproteobacteria bacterium]MDH5735501.1 hypothetical protein [Gammaproteobacteria bacterium]
MSNLGIFINNDIVFEFDKDITLESVQHAFLDRMDADMNKGIKIRGELIREPDGNQRAIFVAMNLIKALQQDNEAAQYASCAYLVNRHPDLLEVHASDQGSVVNIEFVRLN